MARRADIWNPVASLRCAGNTHVSNGLATASSVAQPRRMSHAWSTGTRCGVPKREVTSASA